MRILVTGSRNWTDYKVIEEALAAYLGDEFTIVHGGAKGADTIDDAVADKALTRTEVHRPDFKTYAPNVAPLRRNDAMLDSGIDLVIAFMLGAPEHGGTLYTVRGAQQRRIPIILYNWPGDADYKD